MNEQLKPCPCCGGEAEKVAHEYGFSIECKSAECALGVVVNDLPLGVVTDMWNARADGWIEVDGAKNIPVGDWMVATCDKESKVATHIAKCRPNVIIIGGHFHFDMPKVYAYKAAGNPPALPKVASCGE